MITLHSAYSHDYDIHWQLQEAPTPYNIFLFLTSGELEYRVNGERVLLQKDDVLFIPQGALRSGKAIDYHHRYVAHFQYDSADEIIPLLEQKQHRKVHVHHAAYLKQRFAQLNQQWMSKQPYYEAVCHGIMMEMLSLYNREADTDWVSSRQLSLTNEVRDYILKHYRKTIRMSDLANLTGRTPNYISTVFKEITGQSPIAYQQAVRIGEAREMLLNTERTVGEVAEYLGYSDPFYFHRVFKKLTGMSPSAFAKEYRS
ncbi:AraC family transcriptional regulator [Xylanibacillus composti]|uniref:Helix-turn-helix domain-containing protein n=1 Tax=Xylanibacillus composti TaxID=1572762 RepID=A0A8J4H232_9BACL|nr:helix-turn-helix domain-containing protein [Xylanibacillus composti]MDT9726785.1 AraC family transcriptional regulator [Xylanibacillus composti]GIQ67233.1 helix-turn-helix domain-containing protein [Xylanibacillus composti]